MRAIDALRLVGGGGGGSIVTVTNFVTTDITPTFDIISANGTTLTVDWGDGTIAEDFAMTGSNVAVHRNYGSAGTRTITFSGTGNAPMTYLSCYGNSLTSLDVSTNTALTDLYCHGNSLTSSEINGILADLVSAGVSNGTYESNNQTPSAPPTKQGITDKATLQSRDWTVTTD